jgi:hypothetical protein
MLGVGDLHSESSDIHFLSGDDLPDEAKTASPQETTGSRRHEYLSAQVEPVEGGKVEMVVMDVGNEDHVDPGESCRVHSTLSAKVDDPVAEHGVRDDEDVVESDRDAAVPEPRQRSGLPLCGCRGERPAGL